MNTEASPKEEIYDKFLNKEFDELSKIIVQTLAFYPKGVRSINKLIKNIKGLYGDIPIVHKDRKIFYRKIKWLKLKKIVVEIDEESNGKYKPIKLNPGILEYTVYGIMRKWIKSYPYLFKDYLAKYSPPLENYPDEIEMLKKILSSELEYIKNIILEDDYPPGLKEFLISNLLLREDMSIKLPTIFKKELIHDIISTMYELERIAVDKSFEYYEDTLFKEFFRHSSYPNYIQRKRNTISIVLFDILIAGVENILEKTVTKDNSPKGDTRHTLTQEEEDKILKALKDLSQKKEKKETLIPPSECSKIILEFITDSINKYIEDDYKNFKKIYGRLKTLKSNYEVFNKISPEFPEYIYV